MLPALRLTYLDGALELMAPISDVHESVKTTVDYLLEVYMREKGIHYPEQFDAVQAFQTTIRKN